MFHVFGKNPVYLEQPWQWVQFVFNTLNTLLTDLRITAPASAQAARFSPRESLKVADDVAPAWRALSEVLVKVVSPNSWLGSHNCSISHPLLDPPADKMLLLIKSYIYFHTFEQFLCLFLLFAQYDLLVLTLVLCGTMHQLHLQLAHLGSCFLSRLLNSAALSCGGFCSLFYHLVDESGWFHHRRRWSLMSLCFFYRQELSIFFHSLIHCNIPRECAYRYSSPTPFVLQIRLL